MESPELNIPENWDLLSPVRQEGEGYPEYRERLRLIKLYDRVLRKGVVYVREDSADDNSAEPTRQDD